MLSDEKHRLLEELLRDIDSHQMAWISGYCWALASKTLEPELPVPSKSSKVTVLSASQTGNAKRLADRLFERLIQLGLNVSRVSASDYKHKSISEERYLILVTSTQGDGEAPEEALVFYKFLFSKRAPNLPDLSFAVLALGDSSYPNFCKAGKDFDLRFEELGAKRLIERVDCDLDFEKDAENWISSTIRVLKENCTASNSIVVSKPSRSVTEFDRDNPFNASIIVNQKITSRQSERDVRHIEIDLSGSGLSYKAGDALGVWFENDPILVDELLSAVDLTGREEVKVGKVDLELKTALIHYLELTQSNPSLVKKYAEMGKNLDLESVSDLSVLSNVSPVDIFRNYPSSLSAEELLNLLRPITPRLYSIASSQDEVGDEVHLTVGVIRFNWANRVRTGGASGYLAYRLKEDSEIKVFVEHNEHFRLPEDPTRGIIMIAAGTGIAPFRAFVQQRMVDQARGKNWLIFGNRSSTDDFLYQLEWQNLAKLGYLHKYNFAWSREQREKIYVQHKILEEAASIWEWLQEGAHIYICGDATGMAKAVENALIRVLSKEVGGDEAEEFLDDLREQKRYQREVY